MAENTDGISKLLKKLDTLAERQEAFSNDISALRSEIKNLEKAENIENQEIIEENKISNPAAKIEPEVIIQGIIEENQTSEPLLMNIPEIKKQEKDEYQPFGQEMRFKSPNFFDQKTDPTPEIKRNIEKFIGENLINKIGILITIIGAAIGVNYSIEHELINPLTRVILGYILSLGLLGFGIKFKEKYENFSAVLVSGAISIMYFITFAAYSFYNLIPQTITFVMMVVFTGFAVLTAIKYDKQVIAHLGLVGAYAVPVMLSDGSGRVLILFCYMALINIGILAIAFKKNWKSLNYSAFAITWIVYFSWYGLNYRQGEHFTLALSFLTIFFAIFYSTFLAYKIVKKEQFDFEDIMLILVNSAIFYGIGYSILNNHISGVFYLGIYTVCNAIIHFIASAIIYKQKLGDRNLFYFVSGLVLVFLTIAIPVQLNGNWVTLLWAIEAAILFWIGRTKSISLYEILSYPVMLIATISIFQDWLTAYNIYGTQTGMIPIFNINFLTSMLFIASFGFINYLNYKKQFKSAIPNSESYSQITNFMLSAILLFILYNAFRLEISAYFDQLYTASSVIVGKGENQNNFFNYDLKIYSIIWQINYSLLFLTILSFVNIKKIKSDRFTTYNLILNMLGIIAFLTFGLFLLNGMSEVYREQDLSPYYYRGSFHIVLRYISLAFFSGLFFAAYSYIRRISEKDYNIAFELTLLTSIIWIASSELIYWLEMYGADQTYKLGLSILWGVYSLILIALGIWKRKKHFRIGAIALFAVTLLKLFFYDISQLGTLSKTFIFASLGILLLIISFLYNKYKNKISDEFED